MKQIFLYMNDEIRLRLKKIRLFLNYNQTDFSKKIGIKQNHLSAMEIGQNKLNISVMQTLVDQLNVNLNWLISGKGGMFGTEEKLNLKDIILKLQEYEKLIEGE